MTTNEDPISVTSDKMNEENKQESASNANGHSQKDQSTMKTTNDDDKTFPIEKDDQQYLTDFQRQKAKYFFNVNLDIENKEYVTWEDVEFYLLFHVTTAGKEGDIEARLSRAARAFWEHVHNQIPLDDGNRDKLTLSQFLDTWASLIDYVIRTNKLPGVIQDLVQLAFELYSTDNVDGKPSTIQPQAFDQLFQKMNLGRPFAIMAYKYLTDNGIKPLDAEKIDSIVKAVITSSDDEHESHFLLPGFFKTISISKNDDKNQPSSLIKEKGETKSDGKTSSPPSPPPSPSEKSSSPPPAAKSPSPPPQSPAKTPSPPLQSSAKTEEQQKPTEPEKPAAPENKPVQTAVHQPISKQQQQLPTISSSSPPSQAQPQKPSIQQEDENIRRLLHYYHIDDGDIVEVSSGSVQRIVLLHPERPLPPYIQQNKPLLQKLQQSLGPTSSDKPKVTLDERVSQGEAQKGPTIPSKVEQSLPANVRQIYPELSPAQQQDQQRKAKLQASQPDKDETSLANDVSTTSKKDETKQSKDITQQDEEKIIATVLKQLAPIVEKRVVAELRRLHSDNTEKDEDEDMIPFPFMLGGGFPFFSGPQPNGSNQDQPQQTNGTHSDHFGGIPSGAGVFPPPHLIMAMMNDLARGGLGGDMPPPPNGPAGPGGFMMFVDQDQLYNGGSGPRPGPRF